MKTLIGSMSDESDDDDDDDDDGNSAHCFIVLSSPQE
jgi:hypothetical protein